MANPLRGPMVGQPVSFATEEKRAIHSWSRISSAGQSILLEALQILSPMADSQELLDFLQELRDEGHRATVLRSREVYGYRSCMTLPLTQDQLDALGRSQRPPTRKRRRKKREVHPSWRTSDRPNPRIQGPRPPEVLVNLRHRFEARGPSPAWTAEASRPAQSQPCLRLTNIQGGVSGSHTARLQIHTDWDPSLATAPAAQTQRQPYPPTLSGIPLQPSQNGGGAAPTTPVALFSQKSLSCPARLDGALIGDSVPVLHCNGRAFAQTRTELGSSGWRANGALPRACRVPKGPGDREPGRQDGWKVADGPRSKVVKVDCSCSVSEARRKAQKILQVDLSPVIQIQPLVFRDFRPRK